MGHVSEREGRRVKDRKGPGKQWLEYVGKGSLGRIFSASGWEKFRVVNGQPQLYQVRTKECSENFLVRNRHLDLRLYKREEFKKKLLSPLMYNVQ